jgi:hypothetical protein
VDVENLGRDTEDLVGVFRFGFAPAGQRATGFAPMTNITVGNGYQFDMMTFGGPHRAYTSGLDLAIIRMRPEADDA